MEVSKRIAIIGSGPVSIIEAIYQAKKGNEVTLFEKTNTLGGAWGTIAYDQDHEFELGCHIWDYHKRTYDFIERLLGEPLVVLNPKPSILIRNKEIPYDWKNNLLIFKSLKDDPAAFISGKTFVKPIIIPKKYKYPNGGCKRMMEIFKALLEQNGVAIKPNYHVANLSTTADKVVLNRDGDNSFDQAIITSLSDVDHIHAEEKNIAIKSRETIFTHYHLIIDGNLLKRASYVRVMDHAFIHRISDMSSQSSSGELVLSVGVFKDKMDKFAPEGGENEIMKALISYGYLNKEAKLIQSFYNQFVGGTIDHEQIKELQRLNRIEVLRSTNLIFSIKNHLNRWSEVL